MSLLLDEIYVSVMDINTTFVLFSLPNLQIILNIKLNIPVSNDSIHNYFMSLDGHSIYTTRNNEFVQGWLTFVDDDCNMEEEEEKMHLLDPKRKNIKQDLTIKLSKTNIFQKATPDSQYTNLIKHCIYFYLFVI